MTKCYLLGAVLAAALMAAPGIASAQNNNGNMNRGYSNNVGNGGYSGMAMPLPNNNNNNNTNNQRPSQRNPLLADNGDARTSKFIGTTVHNNRDQNIGSIDDILIGRNGVWAVISTNNKKVAVPFQDFVVGDANIRGNDKLVLPNATQAQLNTMPAFHYDANNNNRNNPGLFGNGTIRNNNNG